MVGIILLFLPVLLCAQAAFPKPGHRSENLLDIRGPYLKTIYSFTPAKHDSIPQAGSGPLLVPRYGDTVIIPAIFREVFDGKIKVYNPNYWGSVPQLIEKSRYEAFDTSSILRYLGAGWDTSLLIDDHGKMRKMTEYHEIPYNEIMGIFFFEHWWLDKEDCKLYKDVIAYLPIREYLASVYDGYTESELRRRLLFMVIPEWSSGRKEAIKYKSRNFSLLARNVTYEMNLYNKPYNLYLNRKDEYGQISEGEYEEWQYHRFDFYRFFDPDLFLERIISAALNGCLSASLPGEPGHVLSHAEILRLLKNDPADLPAKTAAEDSNTPEKQALTEPDMLPEDYPLSDLNSIIFTEDWYLNPESLQIYKVVKSLTITRTETKEDPYTGEFIKGKVIPLIRIRF